MADLGDLSAFCTQMKTNAGAMTDITVALEYPPGAINDPPEVVFYPTAVRASHGPSKTFMYSFNLDIVLGRAELRHATTHARKFLGRGLQMLYADLTVGGTCKILENIQGLFGAMPSYGEGFLGVRFTFDAKLQHTGLTVSA